MSIDVQNKLLLTMSLETVWLENKSVSALNVANNADGIFNCILAKLSQLLVALFSGNQVYIFLLEDTVNHVTLGTMSLLACCLLSCI